METTIIISTLTIVCLIISIIFKPTITIKNKEIQTFWIIPLIGLLFLILFKQINLELIKSSLFSDSSINPIKILILFLSISFLSISLDEAGFFKLCALKATNIKGDNQKILFISLSIIVSCLTIFTSNDIIILTFTPFICYFCKHANINPLPYLIGEFVFANTLSMMLIIGNPTNIYLAESFQIDFLSYFKTMLLPTLFATICAFLIIYTIFRKQLNKPLTIDHDSIKVETNSFTMIICLIHLIVCTIILAISSYINIQMWIVALLFAISLLIISSIYSISKKNKFIIRSIKRVPYNLIPFVLSMFIIVFTLNNVGAINIISSALNNISTNSNNTILEYGVGSFVTCNIINNIPMCVMFEKVIANSEQIFINEKIYSSIIASNIGAYLSPVGALAGIMWMSLLNKTGVNFSFKSFLKYGIIISPIILVVALVTLSIVI